MLSSCFSIIFLRVAVSHVMTVHDIEIRLSRSWVEILVD